LKNSRYSYNQKIFRSDKGVVYEDSGSGKGRVGKTTFVPFMIKVLSDQGKIERLKQIAFLISP